jgi:hypothetical protein
MTLRHAPWAISAAVLWLTACSTMPPVAPEDWDPETGRPSMTAPSSNVATDTPAASRSDRVLSRDEALEAVHRAAPGTDAWDVLVTTVGPIRDVYPNWNLFDWSRELPEETRIWYVALRSGDEGVLVFLDAVDGTIYEVAPGIVD